MFGEHIYDIDNLPSDVASKKFVKCNTICNECFEYYIKDIDTLVNRFPKELNIVGSEMEAFALFYMARYLNKKASCLLTVVDSHCKNQEISPEDREKSLNDMIILALESAIKL